MSMSQHGCIDFIYCAPCTLVLHLGLSFLAGKLVDSEATQNAGLPGTEAHPQDFNSGEIPCLLLGHPDIEFRFVSKSAITLLYIGHTTLTGWPLIRDICTKYTYI